MLRQQRQDTALRREVMLCYTDLADPADMTEEKKWVGRLRVVHLVTIVIGQDEYRSIADHAEADWAAQKSRVDCSA